MDLSFIKKAIRYEGGFPLREDILDRFLKLGQEIIHPPKQDIITPHSVDTSIWITANGVSKAFYFDGKKEYVIGFSGPGTVTLSPIGYLYGKPAFIGFQTITECRLLRISKNDFNGLMVESAEFSHWMFGICIQQMSGLELKAQRMSESDIISNYERVMKTKMQFDVDGFDLNRPDLVNLISSKDLASYLGITQSYLSNIRKELLKRRK